MHSSAARSAVRESLAKMAIESRRQPDEVRPIGDQVMVLPDLPIEKTKGGLYIPEVARRHETFLRTGTVVAVGLGDMLAGGARGPMFSKVGDRVVYDQASNRVVVLDGVEYIILHDEQHVLGLLEEEKEIL